MLLKYIYVIHKNIFSQFFPTSVQNFLDFPKYLPHNISHQVHSLQMENTEKKQTVSELSSVLKEKNSVYEVAQVGWI